MKIIKMCLVESTLTGQAIEKRNRQENLINQLLRRVVVQVGGNVRFVPSFFLNVYYFLIVNCYYLNWKVLDKI